MSNTIYRYKFSPSFMESILYFSKKYEFEDKNSYKEEWEKWTEENNEMIEEETKRLVDLGYEGDVLDKMYKSSRYYFRKKSLQKLPPKERKQYISISKEYLNKMDEFILISIQENKKPKDSYLEFLQINDTFIHDIMTEMNDMEITDIDRKLKKTYKNRHFMLNQLR